MNIQKTNPQISVLKNQNYMSFGNGSIKFNEIDNLKIENYRQLSPTTIAGGTFSRRELSDLQKLHKAGLDNIIDFRAEAQNNFGGICKKEGFCYLNFPLDSFWYRDKSPYFNTRKDGKKIATEILIDKLNAFKKLVKTGNTYMGCHYGVDRTNIGAILYYLFSNDDSIPAPKILNWSDQSKKSVLNKDYKIVKRILKSLTSEQKHILDLPENINEQAFKKFKQILLRNKLR